MLENLLYFDYSIVPHIRYWVYYGAIALFVLMIDDIRHILKPTEENKKKARLVDDRKNFLMYGVSLSLLSHINTGLLMLVAILFGTVMIRGILIKLKTMGEADANTISWIFLGLGIISPIKLLFFILILIASTSIVHLFRKLLRKEGPYAYYPVLLITFVVSMFFMGLY